MCVDRAFTGVALSCFFSGVPDSEIQRDGVADDTSATTGQLLTVFCFINRNLTQFQIAVYYNLITF